MRSCLYLTKRYSAFDTTKFSFLRKVTHGKRTGGYRATYAKAKRQCKSWSSNLTCIIWCLRSIILCISYCLPHQLELSLFRRFLLSYMNTALHGVNWAGWHLCQRISTTPVELWCERHWQQGQVLCSNQSTAGNLVRNSQGYSTLKIHSEKKKSHVLYCSYQSLLLLCHVQVIVRRASLFRPKRLA